MNEDFGVTWLAVPDVCDRLGIEAGKVRRLLQDGELLAIRRGEGSTLQIPELFLAPGDDGEEPLASLRGTLVVLRDGGFSDEEAMRWLLTDHDELAESPVVALRGGRKHAVRRVAQVLGF